MFQSGRLVKRFFSGRSNSEDDLAFKLIKYGPKVAVGLVGGFAVYKSIAIVPANCIGHANLFGNVGERLLSGLHFINPFSQLVLMPLTTRRITSNVDLSSSEGLALSVQIDINYNLDNIKTRETYLEFKGHYEEILMKPLISALVRDTVSGYEAKALYCEKTREQIRKKINNDLTEVLGSRGFIITQTLLSRIDLPAQLKQAIENKLRMEQENEAFTFKLEQEKKEAERKKIEAQGIRDFQDIVSKGLTQDALKWKSLEATLALAKSNNTKVIVIGNSGTGGLPIILGESK